jgi:hypothetical protein
VRQWQLKEGDHIDWSWEARNGEMVIVIKKVEHFGNQAGTNTQDRKTKKTVKKN